MESVAHICVSISPGLLDSSQSGLVEVSTDGKDEFFVLDSSISAGIELGKQSWDVFLADANFEVSAGLGELNLSQST